MGDEQNAGDRRLILMRHAKSSWVDTGCADHDRPLNLRGRLAASLMGAWLAELDRPLEAALVSTSLRTRETWARMEALLPAPPSPEFRPDLYEAQPEDLLAAARGLPSQAGAALMLGHSPGMEILLDLLAPPGRGGGRRMPTGAAAVLALDGDWTALAPGAARLIALETPKTLV